MVRQHRHSDWKQLQCTVLLGSCSYSKFTPSEQDSINVAEAQFQCSQQVTVRVSRIFLQSFFLVFLCKMNDFA